MTEQPLITEQLKRGMADRFTSVMYKKEMKDECKNTRELCDSNGNICRLLIWKFSAIIH